MILFLAAAALFAGASAVPMAGGSLSFSTEMRLTDAAATSDLTPQFRYALAEAVGIDSENVQVVIDSPSARRSLQSGGTTLTISYVITCGTSCDAVSDQLNTLSGGGAASEAFAASIISAVNSAALASGSSR